MIERLHSLHLEIWTYGNAAVRFSSDSMRVTGWDDAEGTLRVALRAGSGTTDATTFAAGSSADDVIRLMGTPTSVRTNRAQGTMLWRYGPSSVTVAEADRRVVAWTNGGGNLRVRADAGVSDPPTVTAPPFTDAARGMPDAPAALVVVPSFRDPSGDGALDGGETAVITLAIRNHGRGAAHDVRVRGVIDSSPGAIHIGTSEAIPRIDPGAEARLELPIGASVDVPDGHVRVRIAVIEGNGFDADAPVRLAIPVRTARTPRLALAGVRAEDQSGDGRLAPRELVEVTARVWNRGPGAARDVHAELRTGADTYLVPESPRRLTLGSMAPGEHRDVTFVMYTNTRARDVRVMVALTEATGRFGATLTVPFAIDRPLAQMLDLTLPEPARGDGAPGEPAALVDEVERDIPHAAEPNPDALAVVVGIERYLTMPAVRFAARDARLFHRYAVTTLGVPDDGGHISVRTDADASGGELRKLFSDDGWLARRVRPTTDVYVYFAGHAALDTASRAAYLLPADGDAAYARDTGFPVPALYESLARLGARSVTVFLDACCTGSVRAGGALTPGARPIVISVEHPALLRDDFAVLAAARGNQVRSDYPEKRHGLFTYVALMGLRGDADANGDRTITVRELDAYLTRTVPGIAASRDRLQTPITIAGAMDRPLVRLGAAPP